MQQHPYSRAGAVSCNYRHSHHTMCTPLRQQMITRMSNSTQIQPKPATTQAALLCSLTGWFGFYNLEHCFKLGLPCQQHDSRHSLTIKELSLFTALKCPETRTFTPSKCSRMSHEQDTVKNLTNPLAKVKNSFHPVHRVQTRGTGNTPRHNTLWGHSCQYNPLTAPWLEPPSRHRAGA